MASVPEWLFGGGGGGYGARASAELPAGAAAECHVGQAQQAHYLDPLSGERHDLAEPRWRADTGRPLLISPGPGITPEDIERGERSIWRYRRAFALDVASPITLGEGCTPLVTVALPQLVSLSLVSRPLPTLSSKSSAV